jgi:hypothetical protein
MVKIHMYEKYIQLQQNYNSYSNYVNRTSPICTNSSKIYLCIKYVFSLAKLTILVQDIIGKADQGSSVHAVNQHFMHKEEHVPWNLSSLVR